MVLHRHAVVAQDVDLVVGLLAALHERLAGIDVVHPALADVRVEVFADFGVFQIFRVGVERIDGGITLRVGTRLRQGIEAARRLLRGLRDRLFEVAARGRHRTQEGHRTRLSVG